MQLSLLDPASDYCQRWAVRRHSWRHRSEGGFDRRRYEVGALDECQAKPFVECHHYSGSYPASRMRFGLWDQFGGLVGVAVLSVPASKAVLTGPFPDLEPYQESLELGRFVLLNEVPANAESWFLARVFRLAKAEGVKGVVSFSDPLARLDLAGNLVFPGHAGIVYQASNAEYQGRTAARSLLLLPDGRAISDRSLQKVRSQERGHEYVERVLVGYGAPHRAPDERPSDWLKVALKAAGVRRIRHPGCHRYRFCLDRRRQFGGLPYPKEVQIA